MLENPPRPVVLCVLDGWGHRDERDHNAIALAQTPVFDRLWETCPRALLKTSAEEVGLPPGQMGNSEVGHTNIGAGRVVLQNLPRITAAIAVGPRSTRNGGAGGPGWTRIHCDPRPSVWKAVPVPRNCSCGRSIGRVPRGV